MAAFAHASEREVAELLDAHGVRWIYEPRLFVFERDRDGNCLSGFRPDFYLPDLDIFIEVTTVRCPTRKNRKLRQMVEYYPEVVVKLLRKPDIRMLLDATLHSATS